MTQVGRAADWTVAAAAVLSGQYPEREQKKRHPFLGGGPTMLDDMFTLGARKNSVEGRPA